MPNFNAYGPPSLPLTGSEQLTLAQNGNTVTATVAEILGTPITATGGSTAQTLANWFATIPNGIGTIAAQNANAVSITGGSATGLSNVTVGTSSQNQVVLLPASSGSAATIQSGGTDSNVTLEFIPKGNGSVKAYGMGGVNISGGASVTPVNPLLQVFPSNTWTFSGASQNTVLIQNSLAGTTGGAAFRHSYINLTGDNVNTGGQTGYGLYVSHNMGGSSFSGGRSVFSAYGNVNVASSIASGTYLDAGNFSMGATANVGGTSGMGIGHLDGVTIGVSLATGATYWAEMTGMELDISAQGGSSVLYKTGMKIVLIGPDASNTGDVVAGALSNNCYVVGLAPDAYNTSPGWGIGYAIGDPTSSWPISNNGTLIGTVATGQNTLPYAAALGVDFGVTAGSGNGVTFSVGAFRSPGFLVDGAGNTTVTSLTSATNNAIKLTSQTSGAASGAGTLTNAPSVGSPNFWLPVTINGTTRYIPAW